MPRGPVIAAMRVCPIDNRCFIAWSVDEFDLDGRLVSRVAQMRDLNEAWGLAVAPSGKLLVANFGSGRINTYVRHARGWSFDGQLRGAQRQADRDLGPLGHRVRQRRDGGPEG